jgi:hypothetical protein
LLNDLAGLVPTERVYRSTEHAPSSNARRRVVAVQMDVGSSRFPAVIAVDADRRGDAVDLIFLILARIEGQGAALRIALTSGQWENLKFLVDGPSAMT